MNYAQPIQSTSAKNHYLASLDGLRFFAFLAVFVHHLPGYAPSAALMTAKNYGWAGVDLFFVISAFLFFHLLDAEYEATGKINTRNFYIRRLLRIYPLMIGFPILILIIYGAADWISALARLTGIALISDNFISWIAGYNKAIRFTPHLWTLSYEFQIYLIIPAAFLAWKTLGQRWFLTLLGLILLYGIALRTTFFVIGARHPIVWVTPFLRPDSVLFGIALAVVRPKWHWAYSAVAAAIGLAIFLSLPRPWEGLGANGFSYLVLAATAAAAVDTALRSPIASIARANGPIVFLGKISFGLYVYHLLAISLADRWILTYWRRLSPKDQLDDYTILFIGALVVTIALSVASYYILERPIERLKRRFTVVLGRV